MKKLILFSIAILSFASLYSSNLFSRGNSDWTSAGTWSYTSGGPSCGCIPLGGDLITIEAGHIVTLSSNTTLTGTPVIIHVYGTWNFNVGKVTLPSASIVYLYVGGWFINSGSGGGSSSRIMIGTTEVWRAGDGDQTGYQAFSDGPLPVALLFFIGKAENGIVRLEWATAHEENNKEFEIERSFDGVYFTSLKIINGGGTTSTIQYYQVEDIFSSKNPVHYYRLKQTDFEGNTQILGVISLTNKLVVESMNVFPNPVQQEQSIYISVNQNDCTKETLLVLIDNMGQEVYTKVCLGYDSGTYFIINPESHIKPGLYYIKATNNHNVFQQKLIVK